MSQCVRSWDENAVALLLSLQQARRRTNLWIAVCPLMGRECCCFAAITATVPQKEDLSPRQAFLRNPWAAVCPLVRRQCCCLAAIIAIVPQKEGLSLQYARGRNGTIPLVETKGYALIVSLGEQPMFACWHRDEDRTIDWQCSRYDDSF
jgi:hypothetical protein